MATLEATQCVSSGVDLTDTDNAASGGDEFVNTGDQLLYVQNTGGDPHTVTIPRTRLVDGQPAADLVVTVPDGESRLIGPFRPQDYNDEDDKIQIAYDAVEEAGPVQVMFVKLLLF